MDDKIDFLGTDTIFALVAALLGDLTFFLIIPHYLCAIIAYGMIMPKIFSRLSMVMKFIYGFLAAAIFILPVPLVSCIVFVGLLLTNRFVSIVAEQVAIQAIAAATAGAGEALEGAAAGEAAVEAGELAAEGASTMAEGAEGVSAAGDAASAAGEGAAEGASAGSGAAGGAEGGLSGQLDADELASNQERSPFSQMNDEFEEVPGQEGIGGEGAEPGETETEEPGEGEDEEEKESKKGKSKARKVYDIAKKYAQSKDNDKEEQEEGDDEGAEEEEDIAA